MKLSHRIAAITIREARRFAALAAERAGRETGQAKMARAAPSFRPLTDSETEAMLGGELLAAISGARRHV